jgi:cyclic beta-1,2-glucan synthetase
MYRAGVEGILGIRREGDRLVVDPRIPAAWPGFEAMVNVASTRYDIRVENRPASGDGVSAVVLDGVLAEPGDEPVRVPLDGGKHDLLIRLRTTREEDARHSVSTGR